MCGCYSGSNVDLLCSDYSDIAAISAALPAPNLFSFHGLGALPVPVHAVSHHLAVHYDLAFVDVCHGCCIQHSRRRKKIDRSFFFVFLVDRLRASSRVAASRTGLLVAEIVAKSTGSDSRGGAFGWRRVRPRPVVSPVST